MNTDNGQSMAIQQSVQNYFNDSQFAPCEVLVATWNNVGCYDGLTEKVCVLVEQEHVRLYQFDHGCDDRHRCYFVLHILSFPQNNTFQAVMTTDGRVSYVFFLYDDLQWTNTDTDNVIAPEKLPQVSH